MTIGVYIDNNVWNSLFERQLDLAVELPANEFCIRLTREAEFEIPPIPSNKAALKEFVESTIARCCIRTDSFFGFNDDSLPQSEQRLAGFDVGRWATPDEVAFIRKQRLSQSAKKKAKTRLYPNEADISLAARSFHSVVLSLDTKPGPIRDAYEQGGKVVFLADFDNSGISLGTFIKRALKHLG